MKTLLSLLFNQKCQRYPSIKAPTNFKHSFLSVSAILFANTFLLSGCNEVTKLTEAITPTSEVSPTPSPAVKVKFGTWGVETSYIAKNIKPGDDFYRYVNRGWLDTVQIPQGQPEINSFVDVNLRTEKQIAALIQGILAKTALPGTTAQQVSDFYTSFYDIKRRNQVGIDMLKGELDDILSTQTHSGLASIMGRAGMGKTNFNAMFKLTSSIDAGNPKRYILQAEQSGLGLFSRDYYLIKKEPYIGHQKAYVNYIEGVLQRAGMANPKQRAKAIFGFETKLAKNHWSKAKMRDPIKGYKVMSKKGLAAYAPGFDWAAFLKASGFDGVNTLQLTTDSSIKAMAALFAKTPVGALRDYTAFHYLNNHALLLTEEWDKAYFDMFYRRLMGISEIQPLEERTVSFVSKEMGEGVGKLYVERYFPADYKATTEEMVGFILQAVQERLEGLDWMDKATRKAALAKLASFESQVGYPKKWHDYSNLKIAKDDLIGNVHQLRNWQRKDMRVKLDEPVRRWEWGHHPQEINAYYAPELNQIVFLAAILQPPFFDPKADPAVNFGAIGAVIGHEIGHGFDDQGSQFDGNGKLRNWWTKASSKKFKEKTKRLVARYNKYSPIAGAQLNGQLTLGENIGDLCGLSAAYSAYQKYAAAKYPNGAAPLLDGFTGNQRFFLGFAQLWRNKVTDDRGKALVMADEHSPGEFRTNGTLANFGPWYEAFSVTKEYALYVPEKKRIKIW